MTDFTDLGNLPDLKELEEEISSDDYFDLGDDELEPLVIEVSRGANEEAINKYLVDLTKRFHDGEMFSSIMIKDKGWERSGKKPHQIGPLKEKYKMYFSLGLLGFIDYIGGVYKYDVKNCVMNAFGVSYCKPKIIGKNDNGDARYGFTMSNAKAKIFNKTLVNSIKSFRSLMYEEGIKLTDVEFDENEHRNDE